MGDEMRKFMKKIKVIAKKVLNFWIEGHERYPIGGEFGYYNWQNKRKGGDCEGKSNPEIKKGGRKSKAARKCDGANPSEGRSLSS
jgi:hypothetical protein